MGKLFKREIGITLIALIITIIVMLILVAVTINVALNGGIFNNATDAKNKTQRESDREQLMAAVVATVDSNGNFHIENIATPEGFTGSGGTYTNTKTGKQYTINATTGEVKEKTSNSSGQVTYLDYDANPLPKFTLNPNPSALLQNASLSTIVSGEYDKGNWYSDCSASFEMANGDESIFIQGYYENTANGVYYIKLDVEIDDDRLEFVFSPENITIEYEGQVTVPGGAWYQLVNHGDDENYDFRADTISGYPEFEGMIIEDHIGNPNDEKDNDMFSLTNAKTYYQNLFVVVED